MNTSQRKYWVIVASKDHVKNGVVAGIAQASHGKEAPLKRMKPGDFIVYYSGKQTLGKTEKCQEFTAIAQVKEEDIYQVEVSVDFSPFRRNVIFFKSKDVSILPLINDLEFITNKSKWGASFRFGFFEINQHDYNLISAQMLSEED